MKRVLFRSTHSFALTLALSLALGGNALAHADLMHKMNPLNWMPGKGAETTSTPSTSAADIQQEAEAANAQAEQALQAAQHALEKAQEAKRKAEALQVQAQQSASPKPIVHDPSTPAAASKQAVQPQVESPSDVASSDQNAWYKFGLFKKNEQTTADKPVIQKESSATASSPSKSSTAEVTGASNTDPAPANNTTPWNPLNWFSKPAVSQASPTTTESSALSAIAETAAETSQVLDVKTKAAVVETEKGNITFELYPDQAPQTVANFAKLVQEGFYNRFNMKFHRVVPGFVIQTGDPTGTGAGGSKERVPLEAKNKLSHNAKGIVAMARGADPNSATSQFYITLTPQTTLDGKYTIFGKVIAGLDVLDKIEKDDMMYGIRLVEIDKVVRDAGPEKKKFFSSLF